MRVGWSSVDPARAVALIIIAVSGLSSYTLAMWTLTAPILTYEVGGGMEWAGGYDYRLSIRVRNLGLREASKLELWVNPLGGELHGANRALQSEKR